MKNELLLVAIVMGAACPAAVSVGIPEPDVILYGHVCVNGSPASAEDDVTLIAKATVGGQVREVGRYKMGDNPAASTRAAATAKAFMSMDSNMNWLTSCRRSDPNTLRTPTSRARLTERAVERLT